MGGLLDELATGASTGRTTIHRDLVGWLPPAPPLRRAVAALLAEPTQLHALLGPGLAIPSSVMNGRTKQPTMVRPTLRRTASFAAQSRAAAAIRDPSSPRMRCPRMHSSSALTCGGNDEHRHVCMGEHSLADRAQQAWRLAHSSATDNDEPGVFLLGDADDDFSGRSILEDHVDVDLGSSTCSATSSDDDPVEVWSGAVATLFEQPDAVHHDQPGAERGDECQRPVERRRALENLDTRASTSSDSYSFISATSSSGRTGRMWMHMSSLCVSARRRVRANVPMSDVARWRTTWSRHPGPSAPRHPHPYWRNPTGASRWLTVWPARAGSR